MYQTQYYLQRAEQSRKSRIILWKYRTLNSELQICQLKKLILMILIFVVLLRNGKNTPKRVSQNWLTIRFCTTLSHKKIVQIRKLPHPNQFITCNIFLQLKANPNLRSLKFFSANEIWIIDKSLWETILLMEMTIKLEYKKASW